MSDTAPLPLEQVDLLDAETQNCPYAAYATLRDEAPVWFDQRTGMWVLTRYEDVRAALLDTETFPSGGFRRRPATEAAMDRARRIHALYKEKGWVPGPTLASRDEPEHSQMRALFDHAFRPSRIKQLDEFVAALAHRLIDGFIADGSVELVRAYSVPLPLTVIGHQMGVPADDIWQIKAWTDAWVQRLGLMQTDDEAIWSTEMEIEAQHYFQRVFERLRREPDDSLLSDLVNTEIPEWGRTLTDNELHAEMMADTFVGGSETTTNALSEGIAMMAADPALFARLKADPEGAMGAFAEEVVRLESPVQGLFRTTSRDVELHGVTIPAGSVVNIRYAAANRDERVYPGADGIDLERRNLRQHLGFGVGVHYCMGAPLARRELYWGFRAIVERLDSLALAPGNDFRHAPNFCLRALQRLHLEFTPARGYA